MAEALNNRLVTQRAASTSRALAHESRVALLHALQQDGGWVGVDALARTLGLHRTTAREHLELLLDAGYVARSVEARSSRGRPRVLYRAREWREVPPAEAWFRDNLVAILLAGYGRPIRDRAAAAVAGGEERARVATLVRDDRTSTPVAHAGPFTDDEELRQLAVIEAHLEGLGFEPEVDPDEPQIHLRRCPFLDLATDHTDVVCSVHLGLARGVLAHQPGPLTADRLEPFVGPQHCILHLARRRESTLVI